ncbi:MAG TPA: c-type cytochrome [Bryobacteraceae bacterium]|nr:c-type cytochrome [Bryobacteraceae bacterium]
MKPKSLLTIAMLFSVAIVVSGQQSNGAGVFTSAQADTGRAVYEKTCGRCHTLTLMGRQGKPEERPAVASLSAADQKFIGNYNGRVPPLAGAAFLDRWGSKTAAQLVARFQEAKFSFDEAGLTDDERIVDITAYVLQVNGAKAGSERLTRTTGATVSSVALNSGVLPVR